MSALTAEERVQRGAAYLDAEFPGWEAYIDREQLRMILGEHCILGQLALKDPRLADISRDVHASPYSDAVRYLTGWSPDGALTSHPWAIEHGFVGDDAGYPVETWDLDGPWRELLAARQARFAVRPGSTPQPKPMTDAEDEAFRDEYAARGIFAADEG